MASGFGVDSTGSGSVVSTNSEDTKEWSEEVAGSVVTGGRRLDIEGSTGVVVAVVVMLVEGKLSKGLRGELKKLSFFEKGS